MSRPCRLIRNGSRGSRTHDYSLMALGEESCGRPLATPMAPILGLVSLLLIEAALGLGAAHAQAPDDPFEVLDTPPIPRPFEPNDLDGSLPAPNPRVIQVDPQDDLAPGPVPRGRADTAAALQTDSGLVPNRARVAPFRMDDPAGQLAEIVELVQEPEAELDLVVRQSKLIRFRTGLSRIIVADPQIVDVQIIQAPQELVDPNDPTNLPITPQREIAIFGLQFGVTTITIITADAPPITYLVRVSLDVDDLRERINQVVPEAQIQIRQVDDVVVIDGQVPGPQVRQEVLQLVRAAVRRATAGQVGATLTTSRTSGAGVGTSAVVNDPGGESIGTVIVEPQASQAATVNPGTTGPLTSTPVEDTQPIQIIDRMTIPGPRQIKLQVKLAELNRSALREIGVNWLRARNNSLIGSTVGSLAGVSGTSTIGQSALFQPSLFQQGVLPTGSIIQDVITTLEATGTAATTGTSELFGIFDAGEFNIFINALRANSLATILAEPELVALDGQEAQFLAGGEFPVPVPQVTGGAGGGGSTITIQFREFGARLQFLAQILEGDIIQLAVRPEFSSLDFATGTSVLGTTVPGLDIRQAETTVALREGQTLAIAGLIQSTTNATTARVPGLGDLPVVGNLFQSSSIDVLETELVVLVTPELVAPLEKSQVPPLPGVEITEPTDIEFFFLNRIEGKTGKPFRSTTRHHDPLDVMKHFRSETRWVVGPHGHDLSP